MTKPSALELAVLKVMANAFEAVCEKVETELSERGEFLADGTKFIELLRCLVHCKALDAQKLAQATAMNEIRVTGWLDGSDVDSLPISTHIRIGILREAISQVMETVASYREEGTEEGDTEGAQAVLLATRLDEVEGYGELSTRTQKCFLNSEIVTLDGIYRFDPTYGKRLPPPSLMERLFRIPNFGRKSWNEVEAWLKGLGLPTH